MIQLLWEDIYEGIQRNSKNCPIAKAGRRHFGMPCYVGMTTMSVCPDEQTVILYKISRNASKFIVDFDSKREEAVPIIIEYERVIPS